MKYFENDINYKRFENVVNSWIDTPYRHLAMARGRGADCILFVVAILIHCQLIKKINYDYYPKDWHLHTKENYVMQMFIDNVQKSSREDILFKKYNPKNIKLHRGDILVFSMRKNEINNHAGLYMEDNYMANCLEGVGVHSVELMDFFQERLTTVFRAMVI